ncbi:MAG: FAD-dependent oxidoreductase [Planctomycetes bacterium]|nr:FAD-dependent oxidoreductase [Planctomycetota bacterium]
MKIWKVSQKRRCVVILIAAAVVLFWAAVVSADVNPGTSILVEAESFDDYGGWSLDTQFMDQMGSPYLIAHGVGKPVGDASTTVTCSESGSYRIWVRTFDWVGRWRGDKWPMRKRAFGKAPGRFTVVVNGKPIDGTFGITGENWHWQKGPVVKLKKGSFKLALKDITGFDGRCDAILFAPQNAIAPPNSDPEMKLWRNKLMGISSTPRDGGQYDLVVVGGGVAGMCSALSGARLGCKVALIQDRPVLGGNTSSEVCVNISGRLGFKPYPNIGNIVKEIQPDEQQYWHKGPFETGIPQDVKRLKLIQAEKNITLFLNHRVNGVEMAGESIKVVLAENTKTGESVKFTAKLFADCTGDGCVGALAKADFVMVGNGHMGRSNLWFVHDVGKPTTFPRCPWALDLFGYEQLRKAPTKIDGWYWESGFNHDPIAEGEYIRDWNLRAVYGTWDAHKNERKDYKTHEIKWLAFVSGKRESRRLLGDVILNGVDILSDKKFADGCVPLSWRLDVHRPDPEYIAEFEGDAFIASADLYGKEETKYKGPYWMPYRCLYSRDVPNLFMAGRNISTTQDALGAARVQRTTGMMGEIVGMAASICLRQKTSPRGVYQNHLDELKRLMRVSKK